MTQSTQNYKRSFAGSVGSGIKSVMSGNNRRYYMLEHKVSSKYHKAGETQRIIIDEIELGRDPKCQVRFDENFETVSRRHAAIVRDGDNWKLIQLSHTNSTYLNGKRIEKEWYLQNGDEIQLSTNGPKLGFIVLQGDKGLVKSIGLTARMNLFRQQALRPYKKALTILACFIVICVVTGIYFTWSQHNKISQIKSEYMVASAEFENKLKQTDQLRLQDSIRYAKEFAEQKKEFAKQIEENNKKMERVIEEARRRSGNATSGISAMLEEQNIFDDVYYMETEKVVCIMDGTEYEIEGYGWSGTGFLLDDGRFVTARHCVEGWLYQYPEEFTQPVQCAILASTYPQQVKIKAYFKAVSRNGLIFDFTSDDFVVNNSMDIKMEVGTDESGNTLYFTFPYPLLPDWPDEMWGTDWAYTTCTMGKKGKLEADADLSRNLLPMQKLIVLGFPVGIGVQDGNDLVEPITSELVTSRRGLAKNGCILHSSGTDYGNSGGPIFTIKDDKLVVIAIVSRGDMQTTEFNWAVPICNID